MLNSSLSDVARAADGKVTGKVGSKNFRFDHLIAATGYRILSFMGLGGLLLGTSVLYGKLSPRLLANPLLAVE